MTRSVQIAYVAGILDGEGCFGIEATRPTTLCPVVQVVMTALKPLEKLRGLFGGSICKHGRNPRYKQAYHYTAKASNALALIDQTRDFLIEKRAQADVLLQLGESISEWNVKSRQRGNLPQDVLDYRAGLKRQVSALKLTPVTERPVRTLPKREHLAYLAGILEAEGCFTIIRGPGNHFSPTITIQMTCKPILQDLQDLFGSTVVERIHPNRRPLFMWRVKGATAADVCRAIKPYLAFRTEEAELIRLLHNTTEHWGNRVGRGGLPNHVVEKRIRWMNRINDIHSPNRARAETKPESAERRSDSPVCIELSDAGPELAAYVTA